MTNSECLEVRYIGKHASNCVVPPDNRSPFVYSPTGRICTYIKDASKESDEFDYIFTFVDLENKICYDIKFENKTKVDCFYFISEDELVIVASYNILVKQSVYKVDFINQKFELKETIDKRFMNRPDFNQMDFPILRQPNKFVTLDGIEYIVLIGQNENDENDENLEFDGTDWYLFQVYLIPKDPANKDAPVKEFQVHLPLEDGNVSSITKELLGTDAEKYKSFISFKDDVHSCFVHRTELYFSVRVVGRQHDDRWDELGTLIGAYWIFDLTKLKDINNINVEHWQLIREQVDLYEFMNNGDVHFAEEVDFREMDNNMGLICLFRKEEDLSISHLYKWNINDDTLQVTGYSNPYDTNESEWEYCFTLHPNGALLIFAFNKYNLSVCFKVAKCFKSNLMSLAFNRAFFHKNTPLRYHPAYRLCYGRMQPLKYKEQFSDEIPENMEE